MNAANMNTPEVAMIMANAAPVEGLQSRRLISNRQAGYMIMDITALPAGVEHPCLQQVQYQEEILPDIGAILDRVQ